MSESEGDKRRNKLGYQRISVACAHCRRRKIRCVMADGDPHIRCQNCIRLNKECMFHPVDQQGGEGGSAHSSGVSHSPQDFAAGQPFDTQSSSYSQLAPHPSDIPPDYGGLASYDSTTTSGTIAPSLFERQLQRFHDARWPVSNDLDTPMQALAGDSDMSQEVYYGNPTDRFGNYVANPRHLSPDARSFSFTDGMPEDQHWHMQQPQVRSMSYGNFEGQPSFAQHSQTIPSPNMHPLHQATTFAIDTQSAAATRNTPGPHSAPLAGRHHGFNQAVQQSSYQASQVSSQQEQIGTWFSPTQHDLDEFDTAQNHVGPEEPDGPQR